MGVEIPINGCQGNLRFSVSGDPDFMHCTMGFMATDGETDPLVLANRWNETIIDSAAYDAADMLTGWGRGTSLVNVRLPSGFVTVEVGTAVNGSAVGPTPSNNCAVLVRKQTLLGGRRNRGRYYLPPFQLPETEVDATGLLTTAIRNTIQAGATAWFNAFATNNLVPMLWHEDGSLGAEITSFVVQPRLATQRTRMRR